MRAEEMAPLVPGAPTLVVRDLARVGAYYENGIGLERIDGDSETRHLGAGRRTLLVLRQRKSAEQEPPGLAGLYHTAFLLPGRAELGAWLRRAIRMRLPLDGVSDHRVSESLYLSDPEGNGIEIYADRPRATWVWSGSTVEMGNHPLDGDGILRDGMGLPEPERLPSGTIVGHVHLRVGAVPQAEAFYAGVVGLEITRRRDGAAFYATGRYHHHLATNEWESAGSPRRSGATTGLAQLALVANDAAAFDAAAERMLAAGGARSGRQIRVPDPWGNIVVLSRAEV
ncbi:MAG: VOC family protein [Hyphomicrobiaceae bacterium]|nr:VOC family protein [Hyphomicrobiaceae bacterium]